MKTKMPEGIEHWTAEQIAECLGVSSDTYKRMWAIHGEALECKIHYDVKGAKPRGGDGSDGTVEWPEVTSEYADQPTQFWDRLTDEEQEDIAEAFYREYPEDRPGASEE